MRSSFLSLLLVLMALVWGGPAAAVDIPVGDVQDFLTPCSLAWAEGGPERLLTWFAVPEAAFYKVGYRTCDGTIVGLAQVETTSYVHVGWDPGDCLEYLMVAYGADGGRICAGRAGDVGAGCPCP